MQRKTESLRKNHYCVPLQGHIHKSCWNNFGRDSQVIKQKLPLFHNTWPKLLAIKRNADVEAEQKHCCKSLARAWGSWLHGQLSQWLCQASSATRRAPQYPLRPSPAPGMAETFQQLHELHSPNEKNNRQDQACQNSFCQWQPWFRSSLCGPKKSTVPIPLLQQPGQTAETRPQIHLSVWQSVFPPHLVAVSVTCCDYMKVSFSSRLGSFQEREVTTWMLERVGSQLVLCQIQRCELLKTPKITLQEHSN